MKKQLHIFIVVLLLTAILLSACSLPAAEPTPDIEATAAAAIAATQTADANIQATIEAGIAATQAAEAPAETEPVEDTEVVEEAAEESNVPVDESEYYELSEEELALLIDEAVEEAIAASETATTTTTQAAQDNDFSQEEIDDIYYYSSEAEELIYLAEELLEIYTYLYGDYAEYADEMIELMYLLEEDMDEVLAFMYAVLEVVEGGQITPEDIAKIYEAAQEAGLNLETLAENQDLILATVEQVLAAREDYAFSFDPDQVAESRADALLMAREYAQSMRDALGDQKISADELAQIAQLGANAAAGLEAYGGIALKGLPDMINTLTLQSAQGQFSAALNGLQSLEAAIPGR